MLKIQHRFVDLVISFEDRSGAPTVIEEVETSWLFFENNKTNIRNTAEY